MATEKEPVRPVQLGYGPAAGTPRASGAKEIRAVSAEPAGDANDLDRYDKAVPFATTISEAIVEMETFRFGTDGDFGDFLAALPPPPAALIAWAQVTSSAQSLHVDRAECFHLFASPAARSA
jgi:hypothetical protein